MTPMGSGPPPGPSHEGDATVRIIDQSTLSSPLSRRSNQSAVFTATRIASFADTSPSDSGNGTVDGEPSSFMTQGEYPRFIPETQTNCGGFWCVATGNQYGVNQVLNTTANLVVAAVLPPTAGAKGREQYVAVHFLIDADPATGTIQRSEVVSASASAGDFSVGEEGGIMTPTDADFTLTGLMPLVTQTSAEQGNLSGTVNLTLQFREPDRRRPVAQCDP